MSMSGVFALMSILSSTIPIVYIQNTRTVIDYSGKIIHTKKQGGRVGMARKLQYRRAQRGPRRYQNGW